MKKSLSDTEIINLINGLKTQESVLISARDNYNKLLIFCEAHKIEPRKIKIDFLGNVSGYFEFGQIHFDNVSKPIISGVLTEVEKFIKSYE